MRHLQSIIKPWDFLEETIVYPEAEICRSNTCKYMHDVWYNISSSIFVDGLNNIFKIHMYYTIIKKKTKSNQRYCNEHNKLHRSAYIELSLLLSILRSLAVHVYI